MKKIPYETNDILICECHSTEHQVIICYSEDEMPSGQKCPLVYLHIHLNKLCSYEKITTIINRYGCRNFCSV